MRLAYLAHFTLALVACDAALGIEYLPRGDGKGPIVYASQECAKCTACAAERAACSRDSECDKVQRCYAHCAPNAAKCRMDCDTEFPLALKNYGALDQCLRTQCTEQCLGPTGLASIFGDACGCLAKECGTEALACVRAGSAQLPGDCERRLECIAREGLDPDHTEACLRTRETISDIELAALRNCWAAVDCKACPVARDGTFACLGDFRWRFPKTVTINVVIRVTTFDSKRDPVKGVTVKACNNGSCASCVDSVDSDVTDADGNSHLTVPATPLGFGGCFLVSAEGYVPMILHPGHALIRDAKLPMFVIPKSALAPLGVFFGTKTQPDHGHLVTIGADCMNWAARGLKIAVEPTDAETRFGYFVNTTIDLKATETGALGTAFHLNLPPRETPPTEIEVTRDGALVSRNFVTIAPEHITVVFTPPLSEDSL
jgi:hypothetical protein